LNAKFVAKIGTEMELLLLHHHNQSREVLISTFGKKQQSKLFSKITREVESVGNAIGEHGSAAAGEAVAVDLVGVRGPKLVRFTGGDSNEDASARSTN